MIDRVIIAITGASGVIYGYRALEILRQLNIEIHLVMSEAAKFNIKQETSLEIHEFEKLADFVYDNHDFNASIASGSFSTKCMMVAPCSIKTLSAVANSFTSNLIVRASDVCLKEGRPLLLMIRETPLHNGHISLMLKAAKMGAIIYPPIPVFYGHPATIEDIIIASVGRALARIGISNDSYPHWIK